MEIVVEKFEKEIDKKGESDDSDNNIDSLASD